MSEMLGWFFIIAIIVIVSFFLITWHLDILDRKEAQKREKGSGVEMAVD